MKTYTFAFYVHFFRKENGFSPLCGSIREDLKSYIRHEVEDHGRRRRWWTEFDFRELRAGDRKCTMSARLTGEMEADNG